MRHGAGEKPRRRKHWTNSPWTWYGWGIVTGLLGSAVFILRGIDRLQDGEPGTAILAFVLATALPTVSIWAFHWGYRD